MVSPSYFALIHFCLNESIPLIVTYLSIFMIILGVTTSLSNSGQPLCDQLASCQIDQVTTAVWNSAYKQSCPIDIQPPLPASVYVFSLSTPLPTIANYIIFFSMIGGYLVMVGLFCHRLSSWKLPINGEYVAFVLSLKRSLPMKIYIYCNVCLAIVLSCYAVATAASSFSDASQILIGVILAVYALFVMINDQDDLVDITSPQFHQLQFHLQFRTFFFGFDAAAMKTKVDYRLEEWIASGDVHEVPLKAERGKLNHSHPSSSSHGPHMNGSTGHSSSGGGADLRNALLPNHPNYDSTAQTGV